MIAIQGNVFSEDKIAGFIDRKNELYVCDFCFSKFALTKIYHYCYYCSIIYCTRCLDLYRKAPQAQLELNCLTHDLFRPIDSPEHLQALCR